MKIENSLRQECMPEMVYSLCKLVGSKAYPHEEIKRLITLDSNDVSEFNKVLRFAVECEFIGENSENKATTTFTPKELASFRTFSYAIFRDVFKNSKTRFNGLARWFLTQQTDIFTCKSAQELAVKIPVDQFPGVDNNYMLGFRFWMVSLGLGMFSKSGGSEVLVFATNNILLEWLAFEKPFKKRKPILAREFFERLIQDCPVFGDCIIGNEVNLALSMGLRVLHLNEVIELKNITDSGDIWHLTKSVSNPQTDNITEIIVR